MSGHPAKHSGAAHHHEALTPLHTGAGTLFCILFGFAIGHWLPMLHFLEGLVEWYTRIFLLIVLPFVSVTILHSLSRMAELKESSRVLGYAFSGLFIAALATALLGVAVTAFLTELLPFDRTSALALADLALRAEEGQVPVDVVSRLAEMSGGHGKGGIIEALTSLIGDNLFAALQAGIFHQVVAGSFLVGLALAASRRKGLHVSQGLLTGLEHALQVMVGWLHMAAPAVIFIHAAVAGTLISFETIWHMHVLILAQFLTALLVVAVSFFVAARRLGRSMGALREDFSAAVIAGLAARSEEAALPFLNEPGLRRCDSAAGEMISTVGLILGRFGVIGCVAAASAYLISIYSIEWSALLFVQLVAGAVIGGMVFAAGPLSPISMSVTLAFAGGIIGLPHEATAFAVIMLQPIIEIAVIPACVAGAIALTAAAPDFGEPSPEPATGRLAKAPSRS